MKNKILLTICSLLVASALWAQTYLPLTRNMVVSNNANIKILGGHYHLGDSAYKGTIIIKNDTNVVIDGDSVFASGKDSMGFLVYIHNSRKVTIKNFWSAKSYFYAIHADSSTDITIENCNFSANRKDTIGWLNIWMDESGSDGGGVCLSHCGKSTIMNDTMQNENDGVAMYDCYQMNVHDNILSRNTAYGIKMFKTDSSTIINNDCSYVNRYTSPSDCGAILLYFAKDNVVTHCDFSYGGDGIFTNANINNPNSIPNFHDNNYFAYNYCSYSPNNAIESVFTDGNTFKHNTASFSNYGLWGGYAIHSIIDSNVFANNFQDGVAIEHGLYNMISNDSIYANGAVGADLWANPPAISGYPKRLSHHEKVIGNYFIGNRTSIEMENTDTSFVANNFLNRNSLGIQFDSTCINDSVHGNRFLMNVSYNIRNNSIQNIQAQNNDYSTTDTNVITCKIYDKFDSVKAGYVFWNPYTISAGTVFQYSPPADLCEPNIAAWGKFVQDGQPTTLSWDNTTFVAGTASLKCITSSGFRVQLHYYPSNDSIASWNLTGVTDILISFKAQDTNIYGFQQQAIRIGDDCGNYFEYDNPADTVFHTTWHTYDIPIAGNAAWLKTTVGNPSMSDITYAEAIGDTWGYGFTLWVDGFSFYPQPITTSVNKVSEKSENVKIYPNPNNGKFNVICHSDPPAGGEESLPEVEVYDVLGKKVLTEILRFTQDESAIDMSNQPAGIYFYKVITQTGSILGSGKFVIER